MIVYVPGRMPNHVGPYGSARYPGTLLGTIPGYYNHPVSVYQHHPTSASAAPSPTSYYGSLNPHHLTTSSLDLPVWPRRMPVDEELAAATSPNTGLANLATSPGSTLANGGPPSPAHSDSDASSSSLELGSVRRGGNAQLKCRWQNCGRWFTSLEQLAGHVARLHAAPGPRGLFYCGWEGCARGERGFNARYKMLVHVRTHTNEKPHHCFQCDKSFSRAENLKIHARSHTGERPYVCPVDGCNKAYSNSSDRFKHTRTHAVDKPYCCKVPGCSKRYTDPSSLRKHVKTFRHYVNNNDKLQEKSFDESNNSQDKTNSSTTRFEMLSPEKNSNSTQSESEKKDSSMETSSSNNTSNSSSKASNSFEEQRKFVEWNNIYNNLERKEQEQVTPPKNNYETDIKLYPRIYEESYIIPDRIQVNPLYSKESSPHTSPLRIPDTYSRIGMQSTPIKIEESSALMEQQQQQQQQQQQPIPKVNTTVDYRNIESIVNSTPCKKENCDPIRHSVIKRAEDLKMEIEHQHSNHQHINPKHEIHKMSHKSVTDCCCHHKCCMHNNDSFLEKTKILSDLLLKAQNPLFRHLLNSSVDLQHGLQNMWSNVTDSSNTCGQDLRVKHETIVTDMEQDLPLDLTINK